VRKLIAAVVSVAALIPAVAIAADAASSTNPPDGGNDQALGLRAAQHKALVRKHRAAAKRRARRRKHEHAGSTASPTMQAIAACESGGNPHAIGGGGTYRGKYQFDQSTWASVGGTGDPAAAPVAEQARRAAMLYARVGRSAWPVCGQSARPRCRARCRPGRTRSSGPRPCDRRRSRGRRGPERPLPPRLGSAPSTPRPARAIGARTRSAPTPRRSSWDRCGPGARPSPPGASSARP